MQNLFNGIYKGKKVFLTGHTGFKGSWMALWLLRMGAEVKGYSLGRVSVPDHYGILAPDMCFVEADIRDGSKLADEVLKFKPDIVVHMAAQPLVKYSYSYPLETFQTNIIGSVNVLEAVRRCSSVRAVVNIATDKCYENREQAMGYIETDPMGGYDPYSASKGCVELVVSSYRRSFFNIDKYGKEHNVLLASCRAGNVIGGGDWAEDRLIPDVVRAASKNEPVFIRSPHATRPWQHVLEPLSGYLLIGQKLLEGDKAVSDVWNLGPDKKSNISVEKVLYRAMKCWDAIGVRIDESHHPHEAGLLMLDCTRAKTKLNWNGVWAVDKTIAKTINWYKQYYLNKKVLSITDLNEYILDAKNKKLVWAA